MQEREVHIFVYSPSAVIGEGLQSILVKGGYDPLMLHETDDLADYPKMLGLVIVILPCDLSESEEKRFSRFHRQGLKTSLLKYTISGQETDCIRLTDSAEAILTKLSDSIALLKDETAENHRQELSHRELEVLKKVALGYTNKEIGDQLFISAHTVISHRKNISEKTGIKTISGLTMLALLKKLIDINEIGQENLK